jgi:hypothetical protein
MLKDLTPHHLALAEYMSELSELAFSAGWMENLEHALWRAVEECPFRYGHLDLTTEQIEKLKQLSTSCDGWVLFSEDKQETYVPIELWRRLYDSARAL